MNLRIFTLAVCTIAAFAEKRPLNHQDYDSWRSIQNQHLSADGSYVGYALFPQDGDGEFVARNLKTGKEWRVPIGARPAPARQNQANLNPEEGPAPPPGITVAFTHDSRTVVFSMFPSKAEMNKARKEKKKPEEMPKNGMVVLDLASGKADRIADVRSFQVPEDGDGLVAYLHFRPAEETPKPADAAAATPAPAARRRQEYGGELVMRRLRDGNERTFADVLEYTLSKDGNTLVYAVASKKDDGNGVYAFATGGAAPSALLSGKGKYSKLSWDEKQTRLAFLSDRDDAASRQAKFKLYLWDRKAPAAAELVSAATPGFRPGFVITDRGNVNFSKDGQHVFFACAPAPAAAERRADSTPAEDRAGFDLWSWKDDYIQPMQKVRAEQERNRSYRAIYHLEEKKLVQLADPALADIAPGEDAHIALAADDREYRRMVEYDEHYEDSYLVDTLTGNRKLVAKKHAGRVSWSPNGKYALLFDGKDWSTISAPDGKTTNLTANLGVAFADEEHDTPGRPRAYGSAGWTEDGKYVLLYDHYDIWEVRPDGSLAKNLTLGAGRKQHLTFRYVRLDTDPNDRWIDSKKPLLLRAENDDTHGTGFYRDSIDSPEPPVKLIFESKNLTAPVKAKNADVLLLTESDFTEFPDLRVTDSSFHELRKVSDANPQKAQLNWGTSELFQYRNSDGVLLKGALYKPENFDPKKKYPMIVYIYERLSQNVNHFVPPEPRHTINISYYVSNGYLVMTPDIVYTTGYPGASAEKCVLAAVQELVDRGFVDENAIGIQGHSWGGYQIAYMITRTNRFRAAAAGAPVADMISAYDGIRWGPGIPRQFQYEQTQSRIGGSIWQYPLRFIENSPIFMADRVATPLLMIHNDADDAVPWYQGIEYFLALRRLNKEVYMFVYNGEPHGLRRRPNQKDYTVRLQQFFDYYLKGAPKPDWMEKGIPFVDKAAPVPTDGQ
ncbi:MAG TPA: prolyl oligopeptidase family serine peptidase [Bryobacteraceae bacterium]|nr:prolyl oligopeptidase family serine peptidase [Bryobacteraceae bacterium]